MDLSLKIALEKEFYVLKTFKLGTEYIELCQLLKVCGPVGTGGEAKLLITNGEVRVDGQVELRKKCKIRVGQQVEVGAFMIQVESQAS